MKARKLVHASENLVGDCVHKKILYKDIKKCDKQNEHKSF